MDQLAQDLLAARNRVDAGWCKGTGSDTKGNVCASIAIARIIGIDSLFAAKASEDANYQRFCAARDHLMSYIHQTYPRRFIGIPWWNDAQPDKQAVLDMFDKALADLGVMA